jgi:hypothetical protein
LIGIRRDISTSLVQAKELGKKMKREMGKKGSWHLYLTCFLEEWKQLK